MKSKNIFDYKLFETNSNQQLMAIYGVSKECISGQRRRNAPHTNTFDIEFNQKTKEIDDKILEYVKEHFNNVSIIEFGRLYSINIIGVSSERKRRSQIINKKRFLRIAEQNKLQLTFVSKRYENNEHGVHCLNKCKCDVGKLTNNIRKKFQKHEIHKKISHVVLNYLANRYIKLYKSISVFERDRRIKLIGDFYVEILKELDFISKNGILKNPEPVKDIRNYYNNRLEFNVPIFF